MEVSSCGTCGFDLADLPATLRIEAQDGAARNLSCPLCGGGLLLRVERLKVLVRGSGAATTFARWKVLPREEASSVLRFRRFVVKFDQLGLLEPRDACYARVPCFVDETGALCVPPIPIRAEFFDCLDVPRLDQMLRNGPIGDVVGSQYKVKLPLKGLEDPFVVWIPLETPEGGNPSRENAFREVNLRVWPNLKLKRWKYYLAGLCGSGPAGAALVEEDRLRAATRSDDDTEWHRIDGIQSGGTARVSALAERPSWVLLELIDPKSRDVRAGGVFQVAPPSEAGDTVEARFGLDFGTSNTCVAVEGYMTSVGTTAQLLPEVSETDWNLYLIRGGVEPRAPLGPDLWPSPHGFGSSGDLLPSELIFQRAKRDMAALLVDAPAWRYGIDFGVPGANVSPQFVESDYALSDFKWHHMLLKSNALFANKIVELQAHYLFAVLAWAYVRAAITSNQASPSVTVLYSYPLSFSGEDLKRLKESAARAQAALSKLTGVDFRLDASVDESTAAANAADIELEANVLVYLDMGGGSTDIAVKMHAGKEWVPIYTTSMVYAGSTLLEGYAAQNSKNSCLAGKVTVDVLRRRVRESRNAREVLADPTLFNRTYERVVTLRTRHFYGYIVEYAARLLAAGVLDQRFREQRDGVLKAPPELKFGFFFLGNGWGFASPAASDVHIALSEQIFQRVVSLLKSEKDEYATQVKKGIGVTFMVGRFKQGTVPHPKSAVALGVLRSLGGADPKGVARSRSGIVGWTTRADERSVPWFARYSREGSGGPVPPNAASGPIRQVISLDDDAPAPAPGLSTPWYLALPESARLNWENVPPNLPDTLQQPFELDPDLNDTRAKLRKRCAINEAGFFSEGAYEVMLEELFGPKIGEIA